MMLGIALPIVNWRLRFWRMTGRDWEQLYGDRVLMLQAIIRARLA